MFMEKIKGGIFLLLGIVAIRLGQPTFKKIEGLGKLMPWTSAGLVICGLSLIGVPGTAGFISKWYLVLAVLEKGWWWLALMILASSLLAVLYVWRLVEAMYFSKTEISTLNTGASPSLSMYIIASLLAVSCIFFGFHTSFSVDGASEAAKALMEYTNR